MTVQQTLSVIIGGHLLFSKQTISCYINQQVFFVFILKVSSHISLPSLWGCWFPCARKDATKPAAKSVLPCGLLPFLSFSCLSLSFDGPHPFSMHSLNRCDVVIKLPARCQGVQVNVFGYRQVAVQRLMDETLFPQSVKAGILT